MEIFKTIFPTNRYICIFGILSEGVTVKIIISIIFLTDRLIVNPLVNCWSGHKLNFGGKKENPIEGCNFMCILTEIIKRASFQYWSICNLKNSSVNDNWKGYVEGTKGTNYSIAKYVTIPELWHYSFSLHKKCLTNLSLLWNLSVFAGIFNDTFDTIFGRRYAPEHSRLVRNFDMCCMSFDNWGVFGRLWISFFGHQRHLYFYPWPFPVHTKLIFDHCASI